MEELRDEIQAMADYERRVSQDVNAGNKEGHLIGGANTDYREGFADGLEQAIFMIKEATQA